jgi:transcriptional regulator of aromatic amino acid metabolism
MNQGNSPSDNRNDSPQAIVNSHQFPTLLMQAEPRQVVTANQSACQLFSKDLSEIEGYRGGQVFDCIHSFTEAGCGLDENCEDCKIKKVVVDTFATGNPYDHVQTVLDIKKQEEIAPYAMIISTEKVGEFVLINIIKYERQP